MMAFHLLPSRQGMAMQTSPALSRFLEACGLKRCSICSPGTSRPISWSSAWRLRPIRVSQRSGFAFTDTAARLL
jgi:hypothetical protein